MRGLKIAALRMSAGILTVLGLAATHVHGQILTTLASFNNVGYPNGSLTLSGSTLYGTSQYGGANGAGTVFSLPLAGGTPNVLASFDNTNNGGYGPKCSLTLSGSTLYGTTQDGGANGYGTVFSLPLAGGTPNVLASFDNTNNGQPTGSLTLSGSTLYGTTQDGGANGYGTVFSLPLAGGTPNVLASFNYSNGYYPNGSLTLSGSTLYGTTAYGGANGYGTVFSLPLAGGTPNVLASFNNTNNAGYYPNGSLTLSGSTLYGTTQEGGAIGDGTVFSLPLAGGTPHVLASFNNSYNNGSLTLSGSTLYGTTEFGGANGGGTVFSLPLSGGSPTVLASFNYPNVYPTGSLTLSGSTLYGTTQDGGANADGTVFALVLNGKIYTWNGAGGGSWATAAKWSPAGPANGVGNAADFSQQTLSANTTVTLDGSHTIGYLIFGDKGNAYNWTLARGSGGTLTLQAAPGTPTVTVNNQTATIGAVLAGTQGLTMLGQGTLVLAASNIYTGGTTVVAGTLQLGDGVANNGYLQGNIVNSAALVFANPMAQTFAGTVSGNGSLTKFGGGALVLDGSNTYTGNTVINAGTLTAGAAETPGISGPLGAQAANAAGTIVFGGGTLQYSAANQFDYSGRFSIFGNQPISIDTNGQTVTFAAAIQGEGTSLTLDDSLGTGKLILLGSNTYTGGTTVVAGTLVGTTISLQGSITNNATLVFNQATDSTYAGTINGTGLVGKSGSGQLTFSSIYVTSGPIAVNQGTLVLPSGVAGGGPLAVSSGATLEATGLIGRAVTGAGTVTATGDLIIGNSQQAGQFNQGGGPGVGGTLNIGGNAFAVFSSSTAILGSQTNLSTGSSLTALNGAQLGNPTSVDATKVLTATGNAQIHATFVNNGVVNGPTGSGQELTFYEAVTGAGSTTGNVEYAASYRPSNSPDGVSVQNVLLDSTSTLILEVAGTQPSSGYDQLDISGLATLNGALDVTYLNGFSPSAGENFDLFNGRTTGSFSSISLPVLSNGLSWNTSNLYANGTISVTPEPSTLVLLGVGAIGLLGYGLRRRLARTAKPAAFDQQDDPTILSFPSRSSQASAARRAA